MVGWFEKAVSRLLHCFDTVVDALTHYDWVGASGSRGANINEHLSYNFTADCLADSAGRALSSVITKMIKNGGFPFKVYTILYDACVTSITDYCGEVTGYQQHSSSLKIHLRAIRAFLGLPWGIE